MASRDVLARPRIGRALAALALVLGAVAGAIAAAPPAGAEVETLIDVHGSEHYGPAVAWMWGEGLTTGAGTIDGYPAYRPQASVTRAEAATMLWRMAGKPSTNERHGFVDVPAGTYYAPAVAWLKAEGLTTGVTATRFAPHRQLSRAEFATLLWRIEGRPPAPAGPSFTDVPARSYYFDAVRWMASTGVTTGVSATRFAPLAPLTRGEMATFLWRHAGRPAPPRPTPGTTCAAFASQPEAQAWFSLYSPYHGDVAGLDPDGNGRVCDGLTGVTAGCPRGGAVFVSGAIGPQLRALLLAAQRDGVDLCGFGLRSHARQVELRTINGCADVWTAPASTCRVPTARPGHSLHERGLAIDFTHEGYQIEDRGNPGFRWLQANAARFGFRNLPSEPWHWSTTGG